MGVREVKMDDFWSTIEVALESGEHAFVALVVANSAHSPGTRGARLFETSSGLQGGTVGGGAMELGILDGGRDLLRRREAKAPWYETMVHRRSPSQGKPSGMICAGQQVNVHAVLGAEDLGVVSDVAAARAEDKPGILSLSSKGAEFEPTSRDADEFRAGDDWRAEIQVLNKRRAAIMGGGHCGLALSETLARLGYVVTVFDTRKDLRTLDENTFARYVEVVEDYAAAAVRISYPELTEVAVMTADYPSDVRSLIGLGKAGPTFPYVGVMGAPAKLRAIVMDLREAGVDEQFIDSLVAPIGLEMKSDTPEEIAISVAAQLLARASNS